MGQNSSNLNKLLDTYKLPIKFTDLVDGKKGILFMSSSYLITEKILEFDDSCPTLLHITEKLYVQLQYVLSKMRQNNFDSIVLKYKPDSSVMTYVKNFSYSEIQEIIDSLKYEDNRILSKEVSSEVVAIPELCKLLTSTAKWDGSLVFTTDKEHIIIPFIQRQCNSLYFMNQLYRVLSEQVNKYGRFTKQNNSLVVHSERCLISAECLQNIKKRI